MADSSASEAPSESPRAPVKKKPGRPPGAKNKKPKKDTRPAEIEDDETPPHPIMDQAVADQFDSEILGLVASHTSEYVEKRTSRFSAKAVHLTLRGHYSYPDLLNYYRSRMKTGVEITSYSMVRETGHKLGYKHTHVLLCFNKKIQVRTSFFAYYDEDGRLSNPNVRAKNHRSSIMAVASYHYKDSESYPHTNIRIRYDVLGAAKLTELIPKCPTRQEAYSRFCMPDLSNVRDIDLIWDKLHSAPSTARPLPSLRLWQTKVENFILGPDRGRKIGFVVDLAGKAGKSRFAEHIESKKTTLIIRVTNTHDAAYVLDTWIRKNEGRKLDCVIIDLTRSAAGIDGIYDFIEQVRDGTVTSGKYASQTITISPAPTVLVMTNSHINISALTLDRYMIWYIAVDRESSLPVGKKTLAKYADTNGNIKSEGATRYTSMITHEMDTINAEIKRMVQESGFSSETSEDDGIADISTTGLAAMRAECVAALARRGALRS